MYRRILHNGFTAEVIYTYSQSQLTMPGLVGGGGLGSARAELARSGRRARAIHFDQRHVANSLQPVHRPAWAWAAARCSPAGADS